jgi:hypothetical protein
MRIRNPGLVRPSKKYPSCDTVPLNKAGSCCCFLVTACGEFCLDLLKKYPSCDTVPLNKAGSCCCFLVPACGEFCSLLSNSWPRVSLLPLRYRYLKVFIPKSSVADPGCLSLIPNPNFFHPGSIFFLFQIPDPHQRILVF